MAVSSTVLDYKVTLLCSKIYLLIICFEYYVVDQMTLIKLDAGGHLNIKMPSYQYRDSHVKDKMVSPTVLSLTWESPNLGKTVFILKRGLGFSQGLCNFNSLAPYQCRDSHVKDKMVSPTVLSLTWESPHLGKMVFILKWVLGFSQGLCHFNSLAPWR